MKTTKVRRWPWLRDLRASDYLSARQLREITYTLHPERYTFPDEDPDETWWEPKR